MMILTHVFVGTLIGTLLPHPALVCVTALLSHFLLDFIPHGDTRFIEALRKTDRGSERSLAVLYGGTDLLLASLFTLFLYNHGFLTTSGSLAWLGIVGSVFPDALAGFHEWTRVRWLDAYARFHVWIHLLSVKRLGDVPLTTSMACQWGLVLIGTWLLWKRV